MIKYLFFGLADVIVKGKLNIKPNTSYLSDLVEFSKENKIELFLITEKEKESSLKIIEENNIDAYFQEKNIITIDNKYYDSLTEFDKELKTQKKETDPDYTDKYFKIYYFNTVFKKSKNKTLYVGHDIWTDTYYLYKYSNINSVLVKDTLSNNYAPFILDSSKIHLIDSDFSSLKKYLINKINYDYSYLENYAKKLLYNEIFGNSLYNNKLSLGKILKK